MISIWLGSHFFFMRLIHVCVCKILNYIFCLNGQFQCIYYCSSSYMCYTCAGRHFETRDLCTFRTAACKREEITKEFILELTMPTLTMSFVVEFILNSIFRRIVILLDSMLIPLGLTKKNRYQTFIAILYFSIRNKLMNFKTKATHRLSLKRCVHAFKHITH